MFSNQRKAVCIINLLMVSSMLPSWPLWKNVVFHLFSMLAHPQGYEKLTLWMQEWYAFQNAAFSPTFCFEPICWVGFFGYFFSVSRHCLFHIVSKIGQQLDPLMLSDSVLIFFFPLRKHCGGLQSCWAPTSCADSRGEAAIWDQNNSRRLQWRT